MKSQELIIMNTVEDGGHFINSRNLFSKDPVVLTTNTAVDYFLRNRGISAVCLSSFIDSKEAYKNIITARNISLGLTNALHQIYSEYISRAVQAKNFNFFFSIYGYPAYCQAVNYLGLSDCILRAVSFYSPQRMMIYNVRTAQDIKTRNSFADLVNHLGFSDAFVVVRDANDNEFLSIQTCLKAWVPEHIKLRSIPEFKIDSKKSSIISYSLNYNLKNIRPALYSEFNIIDLATIEGIASELPYEENVFFDLDAASVPFDLSSNNSLPGYILSEIAEDLSINTDVYIAYSKAVCMAIDKYNVNMGLWDCPPVFNMQALAFDILMSHSIPVVGVQHGGLFANQHGHEVDISDTSKCSHYISYGFTGEDVQKVYPDVFPRSVIYPLGLCFPEKKEEIVQFDIIFPITNTISMLEFGMCRQKPDILANRQHLVLEFLDSIKLRVLVKPLPGSSQMNLALWETMSTHSGYVVNKDLMFSDIMAVVSAKAIIIEHPTTTLYEVLGLDIEIFLLNDEVRPIEQDALDMLKKRVHYFESVEDLILAVRRYFEGRLEKKRDNAFYNRFVQKEKPELNILSLIRNISSNYSENYYPSVLEDSKVSSNIFFIAPEEVGSLKPISQFNSWCYLGTNYGLAIHLENSSLKEISRIPLGKEIQEIAEKIRTPFLNWTDEMLQLNSNLPWLAGDVVSKNPYSSLFSSLCFLMLSTSISKRDNAENILVVVENPGLRRQLIKQASKEMSFALNSNAHEKLRGEIEALYKRHAETMISLWSSDAYTDDNNEEIDFAIVTYVDDGVLSASDGIKDRYFGRLPEWLRKSGYKIAWIPFICQTSLPWDEAARRVRSSQGKVLMMQDFLKPEDYRWASEEMFNKCDPEMMPETCPLFEGLSVEEILREDLFRIWASPILSNHLLFWPFLSRLKDQSYIIKQFIYPFENQHWEKIFCSAVRRFFPDTLITAYQHATVPRIWLTYFPTAQEWSAGTLPDKIVCNGKYSYDIFFENGYPEECVQIGPALRYEYLYELMKRTMGSQLALKRILVAFPIGHQDSEYLLDCVIHAFINLPDVQVTLKPHPTFLPRERFQRLLPSAITFPDNFLISDTALDKLLLNSDLLIFSNTACVYEALVVGLPVIKVIPETFLDVETKTPVEALPGFRKAYGPSDIRKHTEELINLSDKDRETHFVQGRNIVRWYFSPVCENTLMSFLPSLSPMVSVIITCYNYGRYLEEAVESVFKQTYRSVEIIIVNAASTDNTKTVSEDLIAKNPSQKIKLINQYEPGEAAINRNTGIEAATGKYILPLDADDRLSADAIRNLLNAAQLYSAQDVVVYGSMQCFGDNNSRWTTGVFNPNEMIRINRVPISSLYNRTLWEKAGKYKTGITCYEDWEFWIAALEVGARFIPIGKVVFYHRAHSKGLLSNSGFGRHEFNYANIIIRHSDLYEDIEIQWAEDYLRRCKQQSAQIMNEGHYAQARAVLIIYGPADIYKAEDKQWAIEYLQKNPLQISKGLNYPDQVVSIVIDREIQKQKNAITINQKGEKFFAQEEFEKALQCFDQAISLDPESFVAYNNKGVCFWTQKKYLDALEVFKKVLELKPDDRNGIINCAEVLKTLGQHDIALELYSYYLKLYPEDKEISHLAASVT
ncbi:MAG: glycosyltransferase [Nitrospirae bacterium]|nr:glycosyltransferase [Nitrospirota bacterium]